MKIWAGYRGTVQSKRAVEETMKVLSDLQQVAIFKPEQHWSWSSSNRTIQHNYCTMRHKLRHMGSSSQHWRLYRERKGVREREMEQKTKTVRNRKREREAEKKETERVCKTHL